MADRVNDFWFAFSGNITHTDGSKSIIECYCNNKDGAYAPDSAGNYVTDAQLVHSNTAPSDYLHGAADNWYTQLLWFIQNTVVPYTARVPFRLGVPAAPADQKDVNDMVLHMRGGVAFEDGEWESISGEFRLKAGGSKRYVTSANWATFVWETDNEYTALIEEAFNLALANVELA